MIEYDICIIHANEIGDTFRNFIYNFAFHLPGETKSKIHINKTIHKGRDLL